MNSFLPHIEQLLPVKDPTWIFLIVLLLILLTPLFCVRLRIPAIVGLILAGVIVGPHGLGILERDASFTIFGKVGLYYIMFLASLEMNLRDVMSNRKLALGFGLLSFTIPFVLGYVVNLSLLSLSSATAVVVALMYASHTLLTHSIVARWGLGTHRAVGIAVGGTIVTYVCSLLVLAVVEQAHHTGIQIATTLWLIGKTALLCLGLLLGFPRLSQAFFRRFDESVVQYLFVLALVFLGAGMMEWIGMEGILGAFLVGLVLNRSIPPGSPLMSHIEFVGSAIFVPYFLIGVGMLVNISALFMGWTVLYYAVVMILVGTISKYIAAQISARLFTLSWREGNLITGLVTARASATLAIALVGHNLILRNGESLLPDHVFNAGMMLILGSCVVASFITEHSASRLVLTGEAAVAPTTQERDNILLALRSARTVVPMTNMALLLRQRSALSTINAVSVILDDDTETRKRATSLLTHAAKMTAATEVRMQTHCRWAVNAVTGISHTARDIAASDILICHHEKTGINDGFYGQFAKDLVNSVTQQVLIYRPIVPISTVRRLHIVVPQGEEYNPGFQHWLLRIGTLADRIACHLTFYACPQTLQAIDQTWQSQKHDSPIDLEDDTQWLDLLPLAERVRPDHMIVFIDKRHKKKLHESYLEKLPTQIERYFSMRSTLIIIPANSTLV